MNAPVQIVLTMTAPLAHADFSVARPTAIARVPVAAFKSASPVVALTAEEIIVVSIGRADAASMWWRGSQLRTGWRYRLYSMLRRASGARGVQSLANEQLETLRLLTCMVVRGDADAQDAAARLVRLGMAPSAVREAIHRAVA